MFTIEKFRKSDSAEKILFR